MPFKLINFIKYIEVIKQNEGYKLMAKIKNEIQQHETNIKIRVL